MLSGIASYFLNAPPTPTAEDDVDYRTMEAEDDWLLVDVADGDSPQAAAPCERPSSLPTTLHVAAVVDSPQEATPPSSPCPMDGSWYVTPPPCFVARRPVHLETSPLENLLIEHPSMSVYGPPPCLRGAPLTPPPSPPPSAAPLPANRALPGPRPAALAARVGWLEQLRPSQRSQVQREQRQLGARGQLERQNRTVQSGNRHPKRRDRAAARRSGANNNRKC
ncbi:LOW QUALITY PROTEIN: tumor protein p53 inducible nuclear protein [Haemaphysalis longicornis]